MPADENVLVTLREMRRAAGLTQAALAARAGVSLATVQNIEAGSANPALSTLRKLLSSLGLELRVKPRAVDWDALGRLGLPLMQEGVAKGHADPAELPVLIRHAALELRAHDMSSVIMRRRDSLGAMLWALRSHFPSTYDAWFGGCRDIEDLTPANPTGRVIKLSRIAKQRLAEVL